VIPRAAPTNRGKEHGFRTARKQRYGIREAWANWSESVPDLFTLHDLWHAGKGSHTWALNKEQSRPFIQKALELSINFFDTANVYSEGASEEVLGCAVRDFTKREEVVVATKVYGAMRKDTNGRGLSPKAIMTEVDGSLRRLGMDYIDLYQIHRWDYETPIEETLEALHDVVKAGKARIPVHLFRFGVELDNAPRKQK
jgi:predicted oxidoreductase